jgi:murein DD-endopeptidase MepM/ murein hydrolase activator NlpD
MQRNPAVPEPPARSLTRVRLFTLVLLIALAAPAPAGGAVSAPGPPTATVSAPAAPTAWRLPVLAPVARGFDVGVNPYEGGRHRGVDLRAPFGSVVRSPCAGRVVVAGRIGSSGGVVTVLCGRWRATVLPLSTILVHRGAEVSTRTRLGLLARSPAHRGLHLGIRRDGARLGYVDPLPFFTPHPTGPSPLGRAPRGRPTPPAAPAPVRPVAAPPARVAAPNGLAPWPAWAGLALALAGLGVGAWRRGSARGEPRLAGAAVVRS